MCGEGRPARAGRPYGFDVGLGVNGTGAGDVWIDGVNTRAATVGQLARTVGYVFQNPDHQIFNATVEEEVGFALRNLGYPEGQVRATVDESLAAMGLSDVRDRHPLALPRGDRARVVVAAILGKKYGALCSPEYIRMVMDSFRDDPVKLRPLRYVGAPTRVAVASELPESERVALFVNRDHAIHHVRERGYVESPVRVEAILKEIVPSGLFSEKKPRHFGEKHILKVHGAVFFHYLRKVCLSMPEGESVYPYVFPVRNAARPPQDLSVRAGYFCMDTFTPLNRNAFLAALGAVDCALSGAQSLGAGDHSLREIVGAADPLAHVARGPHHQFPPGQLRVQPCDDLPRPLHLSLQRLREICQSHRNSFV